ncbi:hypothetical protein BDA96_03G355000 [Sorghum bicolor]|uniref:Las1-like protein n=2 Tax=Sorghum bicolor TaxID=4558 RepID=A0A921RGT6_SORBI|nr:uncharacterized protein LOC8055266 [Sorghum bicolor]EES03776.1 hypothetical protein SORBI_3003G329200 [Sorghum bicolor]KAG0539822.1 hypothetical protein BDA96_03G355000 [Sorghum bicolor]|eukprot:XP_002458656.1 uncharacterized protein LOC8055266 [Sorghum bicolor]
MAAAEAAPAPAPEASDFYDDGAGGGLSTGRKLVPWSSWTEWRFVRDGLFSPFPAAALRRIAAWRSRGSLPIPVDVTAAFVEIRLRDPFFRNGLAGDDALESEEMLAMLYSMAIMRLVNGFVENPYKKTGLSISELAEAVGIPRVLVDIRHESSHRSLPSLRLLRLASIKAFDWLKCIYWDRQTNSIPDAQVELRLRLHEIAGFLKEKNAKESKSGSKRKRSEKLISKAMKYARRLYYACPSEVVSVLLDLMELDAADSESSDVQETNNLAANHSSDIQLSNSDMKTIVLKLSEKEPRLLLSVLKSVVEMIDAKEQLTDKGESYSWQPVGPSKMKRLCSLVLWLVTNLKELKDSGYIGLIHEIGVLSSDKNAIPRFCLSKLLQKLLNLSTIGERCLIDAVLLLIEMVNDTNVKEKLRKLPVLCLGRLAKSSFLPESRTICNQQGSVENAIETLELFKVQLKRQKNGTTEGSFNTSTPEKHDRWSVAKSWTPCPIGTVPCSFSSCAVLPAFDVISHEQVSTLENETFEEVNHSERFEPQTEELVDESILEIPKSSPEYEISDVTELTCPLKGRLLVGGVWKMVAEEELLLIKSKMKILL